MLAKNFVIIVLAVKFGNTQTTQPTAKLPPEIAYPSDELYGIYQIRNKTIQSNVDCLCEENYKPDQPWSKWSLCQGDSSSSFLCHRGITYRSIQCANGTRDFCVKREWRFCYHEQSCRGNWIEWEDSSAQCSHSCGGGHLPQVRICYRDTDSRIGIYCRGSHRRPYDIVNVPCNTQPCTVQPPTAKPSPSSSTSLLSSLQPNLSTWIAAGVGGGLLLLVIITAICISKNKKNGRTDRLTKHISKNPNDFEILDSSSSPRGRPTTKETIAMQNNDITHNRSSNTLGDLPEVPPILHYSFHNGKPVSCKNAVYTLPSSPSSTNFPSAGQNRNVVEVPTYMESSTPFCSGDRQSSTKDHPAAPIRSPISDNAYLETTSSRSQLIKKESSLLCNTARRPTVDSIKTSTFGSMNDLSSLQQSNARPDSHIYADIPATKLQ